VQSQDLFVPLVSADEGECVRQCDGALPLCLATAFSKSERRDSSGTVKVRITRAEVRLSSVRNLSLNYTDGLETPATLHNLVIKSSLATN